MNKSVPICAMQVRNRIVVTPEECFAPRRKNFKENLLPKDWMKLIDKYPEFLPKPMYNSPLLVHRDIDHMLARRNVIDIPEFYVGTIMSVTATDQYAETKKTKFTGICVHRTGQLLNASFTLRNIIDGMGIEISYDLYCPLILSIEVLRLEKRLDDSLLYLRDALPEYSTIPEDMKPEITSESSEVSVNKVLVKMRPRPWTKKWEYYDIKGVEKLEGVPEFYAENAKKIISDDVYSYDLMHEYRQHCTEEQMYSICKRLADHERDVVQVRQAAKLRRFIRVAKSPISAKFKTEPKPATETAESSSKDGAAGT